MHFKAHQPSFIDTDAPLTEFDFSTLEELLAHPHVSQFAVDPRFLQFSLSDGHTLMVEYDQGYEWWVVGYVRDHQELDLPVWKYKKRESAH